jgi:hypothetical protein
MRFSLLTICLTLLAASPASGQEAAPPSPEASPEPLVLIVVATETPPSGSATEATPVSVVSEPSMVGRADAPVSDDFAPGWLGIGTSILIGTRPTEGGFSATWLGGFDVAFRIDTHVSLGIRRAHFGMFGDERYWTVGASPFVELALRPWERIDLYGQLGAALDVQIRTRDIQTQGLGIAPFGGVGMRFFLDEMFSLSVEGVVHVPLVNGLSLGEVIAPPMSVAVQGGVGLSFHFE